MALRATGWRRSPRNSSRLVRTVVPEALRPHLERTRVMALTAQFVLGRVRDVCDGSILLVKGPEAAIRYPHGARGYGDLDLLVPDAAAVQRQLRGAGFDEMPDPEGIFVGSYHLPPLRWRGSLYVEVHTEPHWPDELRAPSIDELLDAAVPRRRLARQGWTASSHPPRRTTHFSSLHTLGRISRSGEHETWSTWERSAPRRMRAEIRATARRWGIARLWETTERAIEGLLHRQRPLPFRLWAGHVPELREKTVVEDHLERLCSPIWAYPPRMAARRVGRALLERGPPRRRRGVGREARAVVHCPPPAVRTDRRASALAGPVGEPRSADPHRPGDRASSTEGATDLAERPARSCLLPH